MVMLLLLRGRAAAVVVRVPAAAVPDARRVPGPRIHRNEERSNRGEIRPADRSGPRTTTWNLDAAIGKFLGAVSVSACLFWRVRAFVGGGEPEAGEG